MSVMLLKDVYCTQWTFYYCESENCIYVWLYVTNSLIQINKVWLHVIQWSKSSKVMAMKANLDLCNGSKKTVLQFVFQFCSSPVLICFTDKR
jgi:hypothetical protein